MKATTKGMIFLLITVFMFGAAYAQFAKPEDAIKYRKSVMFLIAQHFKRMGAVVQGKSAYEKEAFSVNADAVKMLSTLPWEATMGNSVQKANLSLSKFLFPSTKKSLKFYH